MEEPIRCACIGSERRKGLDEELARREWKKQDWKETERGKKGGKMVA